MANPSTISANIALDVLQALIRMAVPKNSGDAIMLGIASRSARTTLANAEANEAEAQRINERII